MSQLFFAIGAVAALPLVALLSCTWAGIGERIWPTPEPGSWQSMVFWPLFRILNLTAFATAAVGNPGLLAIPDLVRMLGLAVLVGSGALYIAALVALGHANTYCERNGLVTSGIYRWTRNPQYATVIPAYVGLAVSADHGPTAVLCAALIAVYVLMALNEEPWLAAAYGRDYQRYCQRVPRFFNWHRALVLGLSVLRHINRQAAARLADQTGALQPSGGSSRRRV